MPEAQPLDPAFCRFPAQGSLTFLDLPQIAPFLPPADRNHGDHRDNAREVCFQDTRMFIDPKGVCHLLARLSYFPILWREQKKQSLGSESDLPGVLRFPRAESIHYTSPLGSWLSEAKSVEARRSPEFRILSWCRMH